MRRATFNANYPVSNTKIFSIHALREEGDLRRPGAEVCPAHFYPRPPRGGRRYRLLPKKPNLIFLSTPSARRATKELCEVAGHNEISIHALREEGDVENTIDFLAKEISIHALREEGDIPAPSTCSPLSYFYPRPPRGGRRRAPPASRAGQCISIHALREEGDLLQLLFCSVLNTFLSTPSARRATDCGYIENTDAVKFLSTPSARRATGGELTGNDLVGNFYPRPPRGGRRQPRTFASLSNWYFYPRPPRGGRRIMR